MVVNSQLSVAQLICWIEFINAIFAYRIYELSLISLISFI
jgi:hypothetical protein